MRRPDANARSPARASNKPRTYFAITRSIAAAAYRDEPFRLEHKAGAAGDRGGRGVHADHAASEVGQTGDERTYGLAGDVALQAADDLALGLAVFGAVRA